jgi:hypothetical protein
MELRSCVSVDCRLGRLYGHGSGRDLAGLCVREVCSPAEIVESCAGLRAWPAGDHECLWLVAWQALGAWPGGAEIVHVWIACVAGLGGVALWSRDRAGLCRPEGLAWQRS